jgi:hypothetical protein
LSTNDSGDRSRRGILDKALPMLNIFSEWMSQHPGYLASPMEHAQTVVEDDIVPPSVFSSVENQPPLSIERWQKKYCSAAELIRVEGRAKSNMKSAFAMLKELWDRESPVVPPFNSDPAVIYLVREHAEMRGYLPVTEKLEVSSFDYSFDTSFS